MKARTTKKNEPVANLYAKALFQLAQETKSVDAVYAEFEEFLTLLEEQPMLRQALSAFMFSTVAREKLAGELAQKIQLSPLLTRFVQLLISKNRLVLIESIYGSFRALVDASKNIVRGTLTTVDALTGAETADLSKAFGHKLNKQVVLEPIIDKTILGGLIVKIQGLTFDGSLQTTIRRLRENLERQST